MLSGCVKLHRQYASVKHAMHEGQTYESSGDQKARVQILRYGHMNTRRAEESSTNLDSQYLTVLFNNCSVTSFLHVLQCFRKHSFVDSSKLRNGLTLGELIGC